MNKIDYINIVDGINYDIKAKELLLNQIERYYQVNKYGFDNKYKIGDIVKLKAGTMLHGTYKNIDGLKEIVRNGLVASIFTSSRLSKYPSSVSVWNIKKDIMLKDYINNYSGGTIKYHGLLINNEYSNECKTDIIPYSDIDNINEILMKNQSRMWTMEQTKEIRFMPSLIQNKVQIGIIFRSNKELLKGDILNIDNVDDKTVENFINDDYDIDEFIKGRKNKDDFFTNRESAILFGMPANLIEGILVGRLYENDRKVLEEIKNLLPNCYICNLDGIVIF